MYWGVNNRNTIISKQFYDKQCCRKISAVHTLLRSYVLLFNLPLWLSSCELPTMCLSNLNCPHSYLTFLSTSSSLFIFILQFILMNQFSLIYSILVAILLFFSNPKVMKNIQFHLHFVSTEKRSEHHLWTLMFSTIHLFLWRVEMKFGTETVIFKLKEGYYWISVNDQWNDKFHFSYFQEAILSISFETSLPSIRRVWNEQFYI